MVAEQDGKKTEVWTSDKVPPMGIIKLVSPDGELMLQRYGKGGPDGESAMDKKMDAPTSKGETKVTVKVNGEARDVPQDPSGKGSGDAAAGGAATKDGAAPGANAPIKAKTDAPAKKKSFSKKKDAQ